MKERITVLARHPKMTAVTALIVLAAAVGLVTCTYTGKRAETDVAARATQWAEAFCSRDGRALYEMYHPEHAADFYQMEQVQSQPGDSFVAFGWSSPWPMDMKYEIHTEGEQTEITYYAMTSDPHRWIWKEQLAWEESGGVWYVEQEHFEEYDRIQSAAAFREAYGGGIAGTPMDYRTEDMGAALNEQAKTDMVYQDLLDSGWSMEFLLNLQGGIGETVEQDGNITAVYTFPDGSQAAVSMIQPYGSDGIWIPAEVVPVPGTSSAETAPEAAATEPSESFPGTITMEDTVSLAGVRDAGRLAELTAHFPQPDTVTGKNPGGTSNWVESYLFSWEGEAYELQISCQNQDGSLYYVALQRLDTGEWLNIYRTPEDVADYGMELPDQEGIRTFYETHRAISKYLTYRLPEELSDGSYRMTMGNDGGNVFITSDADDLQYMKELTRYVELDFIPEAWRSAGAVERYIGGWPAREFANGELMRVGQPWNHSWFLTEPVSVIDCEAPALLILVGHDLYTAASLADAEAAHGAIPEENQTSRMWYVFFAQPDSDEMYSICLNADLYQREDVLKVARSVYFTENAWTKQE